MRDGAPAPPASGGPAPRVSVVLPVFDAERYLAEAIESVLDQTFADLELLVIDDGSRDGSLAVAERYARLDPRVALLRRPHGGIVPALNDGIARSRGAYVARMDADDRSRPERLARQVAYLDAHPKCVLVGCDHLEIDAEGLPIAPRGVPLGHAAIEKVLLSGIAGAITHAACLLRRSALAGLGPVYRERYPVGEDLDLFLRLGERGRLANLPEPLYEVRRHPASVSRRGSERHFQALKRAIVEEACARRGLPPEAVRIAHGARDVAPWEHHLRFARRALGAGNVATARKHAALALRARPWSPGVLRAWLRARHASG